jgi:DNA-binding PadR family transcriptional regulator
MYGYEMVKLVNARSNGQLHWKEGSLYPALHRLEARGLIGSQWTLSETNRRVRAYSLTEQGRAQLRAELSRWERFSAAVSRAFDARRPRTT